MLPYSHLALSIYHVAVKSLPPLSYSLMRLPRGYSWLEKTPHSSIADPERLAGKRISVRNDYYRTSDRPRNFMVITREVFQNGENQQSI